VRQFLPSGSYCTQVGPVEVVDGILVIADQSLYDACARNRACAHTLRIHVLYEALPGFVGVLAELGTLSHTGDHVAEVHEDPFIGNQWPQRHIFEVMSSRNEVVRYQVLLQQFDRFVYTNDLLFPVRGTETFDAAANSFCRLLRNWPKAVFIELSVANNLAEPIGHAAGLAEYLDQLTLVATEKNDAVCIDRSSRMSEMLNPSRSPLLPTDHRRAADTWIFRGPGPLLTEWSAGLFSAPRTFDLSRWLPPVPDWEPTTEDQVATQVVISYLADSLRNEYSCAWQFVYSEYSCNMVAAWICTLQKEMIFVCLDQTLPYVYCE